MSEHNKWTNFDQLNKEPMVRMSSAIQNNVQGHEPNYSLNSPISFEFRVRRHDSYYIKKKSIVGVQYSAKIKRLSFINSKIQKLLMTVPSLPECNVTNPRSFC